MEKESLSFVMVGHIDHGKSTLIGRLMYDTGSLPEGKMEEIAEAAKAEGKDFEIGFVMDHLHEERERGITIDTAQTFFSSPTRDYVIIDAPGHKEFIKNMITGASQAEACVLLCSVAEGVQEQTKRHAYVIEMLGLEQVVVAYNKMDRVGYDQARFEAVKADMNAFLDRIGVEPSIEVPISAREGDNVARPSENMAWYDGPTIVEALDVFKKIPAPTEKVLRFPVQDVYDVGGRPIVVGRVESGILEAGHTLHFVPGERKLAVKEIRQFGRDPLRKAEAGECIGLIVDGDGLKRGDVGCPEGDTPHLADQFQASVFWLSPEPFDMAADATGLTIRCATQEKPCRIAEIRERLDSGSLAHLSAEEGRLEGTEVGEVVLEVAEPLVVESFYDVAELGRFVLVKNQDVVAGGIVTHPGR